MRLCLFCTNKADSKEDVWPLWITSQFPSPTPTPVDAEIAGKRLPPWTVYQPELKVKWVCRQCNNGWMSRLETDVTPHVQPMLEGRKHRLPQSSQGVLAIWALKTAMALEGIDSPSRRVFTQEQRIQLRTLSCIPWRSTVWLATSADHAYFMSAKNRHLGRTPSQDPNGASITIVLAHFAVQLLTIQLPNTLDGSTRVTTQCRKGPWSDATLQIWPPSGQPAVWPPSLGLNGEAGLNALADRFDTAGMPDSDCATIAV